jgi:hypothetical protein
MDDVYGIFLIATGNYTQYLENTLLDIKHKFFHQHKRVILISTNDVNCKLQFYHLVDEKFQIHVNIIKHLGYPSDTLYRFEYFLQFNQKIFESTTYLCFMNVNIKITKIIDDLCIEHFDLFFVSHPENKNCDMFVKSVETNKKNTAYVDKSIRNEYICGGFHGGKTEHFLLMCNILKKKIRLNDNNNMCAKWHDESHLNWYNCNCKSNIKILECDYMTNMIEPIKKKHQLVRSHEYHIIGWSGNILIDILNGCKTYCNGYNVGYQFANIKYNNSRDGLLKNFFRAENRMKITKYPTKVKCDIFDENKIKEFVSMLNINFDTKLIRKFQKKHSDCIGIILLNINNDSVKKINKLYPEKKLFYRPNKTEYNLLKILSLKKIICDDDFL